MFISVFRYGQKQHIWTHEYALEAAFPQLSFHKEIISLLISSVDFDYTRQIMYNSRSTWIIERIVRGLPCLTRIEPFSSHQRTDYVVACHGKFLCVLTSFYIIILTTAVCMKMLHTIRVLIDNLSSILYELNNFSVSLLLHIPVPCVNTLYWSVGVLKYFIPGIYVEILANRHEKKTATGVEIALNLKSKEFCLYLPSRQRLH